MATSIFLLQFDPNAQAIIIPDPLNYNISVVNPGQEPQPPAPGDPPGPDVPIQCQVIADPAIIALLKANPNIAWVSDVSP